MKRLILSVLAALFAQIGLCKSVGLWKDHRSYITDGMLKTLQDEGWETVILEKKDLSDREKLDKLDVIFLPGGWNAYYFANFNARREMVRFVAGGKGILAGAFRSGYVRSANRPLFPEVGATYNRVNGPYVWGYGDSELAKAIDKPFCPGGWDHLVVKIGTKGKVFAVSADDPVGVYGEVYGGRYLIFGAFIGMDAKTEPMKGTSRSALLAMLDWLNSAPKLNDAQKAQQQARADLDFLRREKLYDLTLNERGPDRSPGVLPNIHSRLAIPLESRLYTLKYMDQYLSGKQEGQCKSEMQKLGKAVDKLTSNYEKELKRTISSIEKMNLDALLSENPFVQGTNMVDKVRAVSGATDEEKKKMVGLLSACSAGRAPVYGAKKTAAYLHKDEMSRKLLPEAELKKSVSEADKTISALLPAMKAGKVKLAAEERKQDLAAVSDLIKDCGSDSVETRRNAVVELGRIGDPSSTPTLIKMLKDPDGEVRSDAAIGLGWMQSRKAVPALIQTLQGKDVLTQRRAAQALGQIGDKKAIKPLLKNINNSDFYVAENAILSLGWLKAKEAVQPLVKMISVSDKEDSRQRGLMMAAVRALGHIGDPVVLPVLEKLQEGTDDFPINRRGNKEVANRFSTAQSMGLNGHCRLAIAEIKAGGRKEIGIRQNPALGRRDKFYGLTRRFNALAGRTSYYRSSIFADDPSMLWPYLWEAGFTGVHQAWGAQDADPEEYVELVKSADDFDLLWIDVLTQGGNSFGGKRCSCKYGPHGLEKPGAEEILLDYSDIASFHGFWFEETYPCMSVPGPEFEAWLVKNYGKNYCKELKVPADVDVADINWSTWNKKQPQGRLKVEFLECCSDRLIESWRESQDWLKGVRKGCAFTYSVSDAQPVKYPGVTARAGDVIDVNGPENYQCFGHFNAFFMEMHKDGKARPAMSEFYNWYSPSLQHDERGFAQHLMHGECFYNFCLDHIFEKASNMDMWSWDGKRWDKARKIFLKARNIGEYVAVPESAANVGFVVSDLSCLAFDPVNTCVGGLGLRWIEHNFSLWTALCQSQIPSDVIWAESLTPEKLKRYRVLVLSDAKILDEEQAGVLRDWVKEGGTVIATGLTSVFNQWGEQQKNYLLSDMFGVDYVKNMAVSDPNKIDTYWWRSGGPAAEKIVSGLDPDNFRHFIHRDVKPAKSLGIYSVVEKTTEYLPGIAPKTECEYDMPLGYEKVKPSSAKVLAKFANGDPALTVNGFGKGLCYLWTPDYPGLCHVSSEWEMQYNRLDFWPNVRELLTSMVESGLAHQDATLPVEVSDVATEVEVTLRQQPEQNRWMVHLLNYDPAVDLVKAPGLVVHPTEGVKIKRIFYPDTDTQIKFESTEKGVEARMRDFDVHDMVVVEFD